MRYGVGILISLLIVLSPVMVGNVDAGSGPAMPARPAENGTQLAPSPATERSSPHYNHSTTTSYNVTLVTGQTVTVIHRDNETVYNVAADVPMTTVNTAEGTFVFPRGVNFSLFDPSLFNVDRLIERGYADGRTKSIPVVITYDHPVGTESNTTISHGVSGFRSERTLRSVNARAGQIMKATTARTAADMRSLQAVDQVYLDRRYRLLLNTSVETIAGERARRQFGVSGAGIRVAVIDTGIDNTHPDLDGGTAVLERDFTVDDDSRVEDAIGHGTHVAGIITGDGTASNGRFVGVAPDARLIDARVFRPGSKPGPYVRTSWIVQAIEYSANHSADVISMSLGGSVSESNPLVQATNWASRHGVSVVVAAGNAGPERFTVQSPGIARRAITVGATDGTDIARFSSRGPTPLDFRVKPDVVAPGYRIISTCTSGGHYACAVDGHYVALSGTSMATPHVSGAVALVLDAHPDWSPLRVKNALLTTARPIDNSKTGQHYGVYTQGAGLINVTRAISTDIVVHNATMSFGPVATDRTLTRTFEIVNIGTETHTLSLTPMLRGVRAGEWYNESVSVNQTSVTVAPGERAHVRLTVDTRVSTGVYSGRIRLTTASGNQRYTAVFGYSSLHRVTVEKRSLPNTTVANDTLIRIPHGSGSASISSLSNGSATFYTFGGTVTFLSVGTNERTGATVYTAETVVVTSNTDITLDERKTVSYTIDTSNLSRDRTQLILPSLESSLQTTIDVAAGSREYRYAFQLSSLVSFAESRTIRYPRSTAINTSIESLITASKFYDANVTDRNGTNPNHLDVPTAYRLVFSTIGVENERTFSPTRSSLARIERKFYRTHAGQQYAVGLSATTTRWRTSDVQLGWSIRNRFNQTLYVSSNKAAYTPYAVSKLGSSPTWDMIGIDTYRPDPKDVRTIARNRHPYTGRLLDELSHPAWNFTTARIAFAASVQSGQSGLRAEYNNYNGSNRFVVRRNGSIVFNRTWSQYRTLIYTNRSPEAFEPGTSLTLTTIGHNPGSRLSTKTVTVYQAVLHSSGDSAPPRIRSVLANMTRTNAVISGSENVAIRVRVTDTTSIRSVNVRYAPGRVEIRPFENTTANETEQWRVASVRKRNETTFMTTIDPPKDAKTISLGIRATDTNGNSMRTITYDGFRVRSGPQIDVSDFTVGDTIVEVQERVPINATVENIGNTSRSMKLSMSIDGDTVQTKTITVGASNTTTVPFTATFEQPGTYNVTVDDLPSKRISVTDRNLSEIEETAMRYDTDNDGRIGLREFLIIVHDWRDGTIAFQPYLSLTEYWLDSAKIPVI